MTAERACREWYSDACILSAVRGEISPLCGAYERCMYAAPRSSFTAEELQVLDAWSHARVCLLAYRPNSNDTQSS